MKLTIISYSFGQQWSNLKLDFKDDERDYIVVGFILKDLNLKTIKLITNNPKKIEFIEECVIKIEEIIPTAITKINKFNENYLQTKKD
ncbi:hypothetical protein L5F37_03560 [Aliarcobacter butzleri]|uniref:hypothetical protein n=1 Tax=Aliarcobacter butzleri TaxID=28197 RepID=UPI001EDC6D3F|nr:hypothetical protein [Aliarcobacter butzleri]MCG3662471.1 hypothetical protein [Aliarcobacter butzleri]